MSIFLEKKVYTHITFQKFYKLKKSQGRLLNLRKIQKYVRFKKFGIVFQVTELKRSVFHGNSKRRVCNYRRYTIGNDYVILSTSQNLSI